MRLVVVAAAIAVELTAASRASSVSPCQKMGPIIKHFCGAACDRAPPTRLKPFCVASHSSINSTPHFRGLGGPVHCRFGTGHVLARRCCLRWLSHSSVDDFMLKAGHGTCPPKKVFHCARRPCSAHCALSQCPFSPIKDQTQSPKPIESLLPSPQNSTRTAPAHAPDRQCPSASSP